MVDDRSTDDTASRVAELARRDARLRLIAGQELPPGPEVTWKYWVELWLESSPAQGTNCELTG